MQKSTKYRVYRRSKERFPTVFARRKGESTAPGSDRAVREVERQLGRRLKDGTKTAHTRSEWVWKEPR